jgi:hypothetical protein
MGMDQALYRLRHPEGDLRFHPVFKLRLAWEFSVESWYEECIRDVLAIPFIELCAEDYRDLEPKLTEIILAIRARCHRHRLELVPYLPDALHHTTCADRGRCVRDWQIAYSAAMLFFTHTRTFYTGREVFQKLSVVEIPSFNAECRRLTIAEMENTGILWCEEAFIQKGSEVIKTFLMSERPCSHRPEPRFISPTPQPNNNTTGQFQM